MCMGLLYCFAKYLLLPYFFFRSSSDLYDSALDSSQFSFFRYTQSSSLNVHMRMVHDEEAVALAMSLMRARKLQVKQERANSTLFT